MASALIALVLIPEAKSAFCHLARSLASPLTRRPSVNGMTQMDADFKQYLIDKGYDVSHMGTSDAGSFEERESMEEEKKVAVA